MIQSESKYFFNKITDLIYNIFKVVCNILDAL